MRDAARRIVLLILLMAGAGAGAAGGLAAQTHRVALGIGGGWSSHGDLTPGLASETRLDQGWVAGAQLEAWVLRGRLGLRVSGDYAIRPLTSDPATEFGVLAGDAQLMVRPLSTRGRRLLAPFIGLGGGATRYYSADQQPIAGGVYGEDPVTRVHVVGAAGVDLMPGRRFGLRVEAADRIILPSVGESPPSDGLPLVHVPSVQASLQVRMGGRDRPAVVAAAPVEPRAERRREAPAQSAAAAVEEPPAEAAPAPERRPAEPTPAPSPAATPPTPAPSRSAAAPARAPAAGLYTVQLGSYLEPATADRWAGQLRELGLPVWSIPVTLAGQDLARLKVGALATEADARRLLDVLARRYGTELQIQRLTEDESFPRDLEATLSFLAAADSANRGARR